MRVILPRILRRPDRLSRRRMLYYHAYTRMISRDGRYFTLFRYEIPQVTYRKFNTGNSNELVSQRERTVAHSFSVQGMA